MTRLNVSTLPTILLLRKGREFGRLDAALEQGEVGSRALVRALEKIVADPPG